MLRWLKRVVKRTPLLGAMAIRAYPYAVGVWGMATGRRGARDHFLASVSFARKSVINKGRPMNITIEPTNICNLQCPVCETGAGILGRPDKSMTFDQFKVIIDKVAPHTNILMYYFMGEPFINKDSYRMIRYAKDLGIPWVTTCTNGDPVQPQKLVDSGIDEVSFQIGGMTQETHQIYRVNSNLKRVMKNLEETIRLKNESGSSLKVETGFIVMKHNEHEVDAYIKAMKALGVDHIKVVDPCVRTVEQGKQMLPSDSNYWFYDVEAFHQGKLKPKVFPDNECPWIYYAMNIHVNGDVVPCCRDPLGEEVMGNLLTQNLDEIWNGERYRNFRERILTDQGDVGICKLCSSYPASQLK